MKITEISKFSFSAARCNVNLGSETLEKYFFRRKKTSFYELWSRPEKLCKLTNVLLYIIFTQCVCVCVQSSEIKKFPRKYICYTYINSDNK